MRFKSISRDMFPVVSAGGSCSEGDASLLLCSEEGVEAKAGRRGVSVRGEISGLFSLGPTELGAVGLLGMSSVVSDMVGVV